MSWNLTPELTRREELPSSIQVSMKAKLIPVGLNGVVGLRQTRRAAERRQIVARTSERCECGPEPGAIATTAN